MTEDGPLVANGNVLTAAAVGSPDANGTDGVDDVQGADGATVTAVSFGATPGAVGGDTAGQYGTLVLGANGAYAYTLNNANGVVQGLSATDTLTEDLQLHDHRRRWRHLDRRRWPSPSTGPTTVR